MNGARATLALFAAGLLAARLAAAQPPAAGAEPPSPPEPIPVPEIARQSERTLGRLAEIEASLAPDPAVAAIAGELPRWTEDLRKAREAEGRADLKSLSLRELEDVQKTWLARKGELDRFQTTLEGRSEKIQLVLDELQSLRRLWNATRNEASRELPPAVVASISGVLSQIARVDRLAGERLESVLKVQNELADEAARLQEDVDRLEAEAAAVRGSLLSPDAPPLWVAIRFPEEERGLFQQARDSWIALASTVGQYLGSNRERFALQLFLFLALLWLFRSLGARCKGWSEREELQASARILSHPVANALLITLLMTRLIHPQAPLGLFELARLLLLVPLLQVLPQLLPPRMRSGLYGLAMLWVFDLVNATVARETLLARVLSITLSGAALAGLVFLTRRGGAGAQRSAGGWWAAAWLAGRIGAFLLALSILANVAGRVRLSELLTDAVLSSAYAAVALLAGTLVLEALLALVLGTTSSGALRSVRAEGLRLRSLAVRLVRVLAVASWLGVTLGSVQLLDPFIARLRVILSASLTVGQLSISLGAVLALLVTLWLSVQVSRISRAVLEEDVLPRFDLPRGAPAAVSMLAHYAILFFGLLFALAAAGLELGQFALLLGAFGVGIGFGLQNIVNNFISGLILLFERPIQVGDTIELGALQGTMGRIGIRSSTIRTFEGAEVIVPNAHLIEGEVVNWTLSDRLRRIEVAVGVAYGTPPRRVLEILVSVAKSHPLVLAEPEPYALFEGFGESSLTFVLRVWTANFDQILRTRSELRLGVHDALEAAGIVIPFPQREVHIVSKSTTPPS